MVKRAYNFLELLLLNMGVAGGGSEVGVTEQLVDGQQLHALLQQVGCETVPQSMNRGGFGYAGFFLAVLNAT